MIKFFRKIRQKTLTESKFGKYLLYAIGEIILVVFGILIALQVNNWNEIRKAQAETNKINNELNAEILSNRIVLKDRIENNYRGKGLDRKEMEMINDNTNC